MYLIEKLWIDPFANELSSAIGYEHCGYVGSKEEAKAICDNCEIVEAGSDWCIYEDIPKYKYKKIWQFNRRKNGNV